MRRVKSPNIEGETLLGLFSDELWKNGQCQHRANAFYLKFSETRWLRFRINCRGLHWKFVDSAAHPKNEGWDVVPYEYFYEIFYLVGKQICRLELEETKEDIWLYRRKFRSEAKLRIILSDGFAIVFHYTDSLEHFIQRT